MYSPVDSPVSYWRLRAVATEVMQAVRPPLWLCVAQAMVAYEWLASGGNKLLGPWFSAHVPAMIQQGLRSHGWSMMFLRGVVMPGSTQSGAVVTWSETAVGVVLLLSTLLWATWPENRLTPLLARAACLALVATVGLKGADYLMSGTGLPWTDPTRAFAAGVLLDAVLALIALVLLGANVRSLRKLRWLSL
jgi:hypothetical protein